MLTLPSGLLGRDVDLGTVDVTADRIRHYASAVGDRALLRSPCRVAPLGFLLAMRGGPVPEVELAAGTVSVHGGHAITAHQPLTAPGVYGLRARVTDVFEKNGRSGPLTVVVRRAEIHASQGALVATVEDQQIVRWRRAGAAPPPPALVPRPDHPGHGGEPRDGEGDAFDLEIGAVVGLQRRLAPSPTAVAAYAHELAGGEPLFTDGTFARALGYADVIVPGPLQSALLEVLLRRCLPGWELQRLSLTFRVSVIAREPIALTAVLIERHRRHASAELVCDLSLENGDGERAALGTATLQQKAHRRERGRSAR